MATYTYEPAEITDATAQLPSDHALIYATYNDVHTYRITVEGIADTGYATVYDDGTGDWYMALCLGGDSVWLDVFTDRDTVPTGADIEYTLDTYLNDPDAE